MHITKLTPEPSIVLELSMTEANRLEMVLVAWLEDPGNGSPAIRSLAGDLATGLREVMV